MKFKNCRVVCFPLYQINFMWLGHAAGFRWIFIIWFEHKLLAADINIINILSEKNCIYHWWRTSFLVREYFYTHAVYIELLSYCRSLYWVSLLFEFYSILNHKEVLKHWNSIKFEISGIHKCINGDLSQIIILFF